VLASSSGPLGLLTVVESPTVPFRHAPGLSFNARGVPPSQLAVFTDGDSMSVITRFDGATASLTFLRDVTAALPYALLDAPETLILGAGTGYDVLLGLANGAARIDAVELNPAMSALVQENFADFAGHLYRHKNVSLHIGEARGFVARTPRRYDLIHIGLLDSFAVSGSGVQALGESYLYTVEAIEEYLRQLAPGGLLAVTRWLKLPPRDNLKLAATAIDALARLGAADPGRQIAMIRSWNTCTLLVSVEPFSADAVAALRNFAAARSFDTAYYPGMPADEANRYNRIETPYFYDGIVALSGAGAEAYRDRYKFRIAPATDDRPYFFHFFKWRVLPEVFELRHQGGAGLIEWGYLVLIATLAQAVLAGGLLILLPLARIPGDWPPGTGLKMGAYFFLLGLAFLFIEMAFIQKFILFLSHPLYSVAVVLAGFLVFAGLGSASSDWVAERLARSAVRPVSFAVACIGLLALLYLILLPVLFKALIGFSDAVRVGASLLLIAPLAFCMGIPFPLGLKAVAVGARDFIPWAWGINGFASVVSAALATVLAIEFGFTVVILLAIALYIAAAAILHDARGYGAPA
jgi:spermidine synthase